MISFVVQHDECKYNSRYNFLAQYSQGEMGFLLTQLVDVLSPASFRYARLHVVVILRDR